MHSPSSRQSSLNPKLKGNEATASRVHKRSFQESLIADARLFFKTNLRCCLRFQESKWRKTQIHSPFYTDFMIWALYLILSIFNCTKTRLLSSLCIAPISFWRHKRLVNMYSSWNCFILCNLSFFPSQQNLSIELFE